MLPTGSKMALKLCSFDWAASRGSHEALPCTPLTRQSQGSTLSAVRITLLGGVITRCGTMQRTCYTPSRKFEEPSVSPS